MEVIRVSETSGCLLLYGAGTQKEDQRQAEYLNKFIQINRNLNSSYRRAICGGGAEVAGGEHDRAWRIKWLSCCRDPGLSTNKEHLRCYRQVLLLLLLLGKVVDFSSLNSVQLPVFQHVFQCGLSACRVVKLTADLDTVLMSAIPGALVFLRLQCPEENIWSCEGRGRPKCSVCDEFCGAGLWGLNSI